MRRSGPCSKPKPRVLPQVDRPKPGHCRMGHRARSPAAEQGGVWLSRLAWCGCKYGRARLSKAAATICRTCRRMTDPGGMGEGNVRTSVADSAINWRAVARVGSAMLAAVAPKSAPPVSRHARTTPGARRGASDWQKATTLRSKACWLDRICSRRPSCCVLKNDKGRPKPPPGNNNRNEAYSKTGADGRARERRGNARVMMADQRRRVGADHPSRCW
jgi:hypothetical protein